MDQHRLVERTYVDAIRVLSDLSDFSTTGVISTLRRLIALQWLCQIARRFLVRLDYGTK
jgi:hypothetical protein